jgi:hypothetical protein
MTVTILSITRALSSRPARIAVLVLLLLAWITVASRARADDVPRADAFAAFPLTTDAARALVQAAWRASGLGTTDAALDSLSSVARSSAWLPEVRLRADRTEDDHTTLFYADPPRLYQTQGAKMAYEARLTWRLDRLLYAGDEPQIEHQRVVRIEARERLAHKTLEAFFMLERSLQELGRAAPGSAEAKEHGFRAFEAAATLDVLTGGWFSDALRGRAAMPRR